MSGVAQSRFRRVLPLVGTLYLLFLTTLEPPVSWMGLACLAILTPFYLGWALGRFAGVGPWAED